ncbi:MAG: Zn-dependent hydrolase [Acetobacteraceae bacterium]|nr:Zn-dependent hydrolase [Acetobacteraceae bacterium]
MNAISGLHEEALLAERLLARFAELGADPKGGITRPAWSEAETACHDALAEAAAARGLAVHRDAVGNLWLAPEGLGDRPAPACGSHCDSVPQGGNYDGAAGVVAGLLVALRAARAGIALRAVALRAEESPWFGAPYLGTRAAFGLLDPAELAQPRRGDGLPLAACIARAGGDPAAACTGRPLPEIARVTAFWEAHIEQGPVLLDRGLPAAAVTAVRGHLRHPAARCLGEAGHSGVVPRHLRRDPALAVAEFLMDLDTLWARQEQEGADLVLTAGMLSTEPDAATPTRIPGEVAFSLDIRSADPAVLGGMERVLAERAAEIGRRRGVSFALGRAVRAAPVALDPRRAAAIEAALPRPYAMASGAGHDAAEFARNGVPAAMVFLRNAGGSHNPAEAMDIADLMAGVEALWAAIRATEGEGRYTA